jgi:hypothetical protein
MPTTSGHTRAIRTNKVIGTTVRNAAGESIGKVEDVVLDKQSNNIMFAVVGFGGFLGMGEKYHPVRRNGALIALGRPGRGPTHGKNPSTTLTAACRRGNRDPRPGIAATEHLRRQYGSQTSEARGQAGHSEACRETYNGEACRERDVEEVVGRSNSTQ